MALLAWLFAESGLHSSDNLAWGPSRLGQENKAGKAKNFDS